MSHDAANTEEDPVVQPCPHCNQGISAAGPLWDGRKFRFTCPDHGHLGDMTISEWNKRRTAPVHAADCAVGLSARHACSCGADKKDDTPCSPWRPASEPPNETQWVLASADGAVRCVAWNNDVRRWENWDGALTSFVLGEIDWWMPIPPIPVGVAAPAAKEGGGR